MCRAVAVGLPPKRPFHSPAREHLETTQSSNPKILALVMGDVLPKILAAVTTTTSDATAAASTGLALPSCLAIENQTPRI